MDNRKISVIIVSYNNRDVLENCLLSVQEQNDINNDLEVIVVEQSDTNDIYDFLTESFPEVITIRAENKGFGSGNNIGAAHASGNILFFLNPDTIITEPVFGYVREQFERDQQIGLLGLHLAGPSGESISFNMRFPFGLRNKLIYVICRKLDKFLWKQMYIEGADLVIRKDVFDQINQFDEKIFMYSEELDICFRVQKAGYRISYFPSKTILHLQGQCTDNRYPIVFRKQLNSFAYVCEKNGLNWKKWMTRELYYQNIRRIMMKLIGRTDSYKLSGELIKILKEILDVQNTTKQSGGEV